MSVRIHWKIKTFYFLLSLTNLQDYQIMCIFAFVKTLNDYEANL